MDNKELLEELNKNISFIKEELKWQHQKWEESSSISRFFKQWGGFYLASTLLDETLGKPWKK